MSASPLNTHAALIETLAGLSDRASFTAVLTTGRRLRIEITTDLSIADGVMIGDGLHFGSVHLRDADTYCVSASRSPPRYFEAAKVRLFYVNPFYEHADVSARVDVPTPNEA